MTKNKNYVKLCKEIGESFLEGYYSCADKEINFENLNKKDMKELKKQFTEAINKVFHNKTR
jgi:hypothetical protein